MPLFRPRAWWSRIAGAIACGNSPAGPPHLRHHLDDSLLCAAVSGLSRHLFGALLTIAFGVILLAVLPLIVLLRLVLIIRSRWRRNDGNEDNYRWNFRHCDPWWPLSRLANCRQPTLAVLSLQTNVDAQLLALQLQRILNDRREEGNNGETTGHSMPNADVGDDRVSIWNQKKQRLKLVGDLQFVLNSSDLLVHREPCSITLVPNFSNINQNGNGCCLFVISHNWRAVCLPRVLAQIAAGQLAFDVEPKLSRIFALESPRFSLPLALCQALCQFIQFVCIGPLSIVSLAARRPDTFWTRFVLSGQSPKALSSTNKRKGDSRSNAHNAAPAADEEVLMKDAGGDNRLGQNSNTPVGDHQGDSEEREETRNVCWMRIANTEQLGRAERILRAATIEVLLACVAGTLRRHFLKQGLRHPPDIGATVPCSCRDLLPIAARSSCRMLLLPIQIPTSVEGTIPRIWAVQRRLADALDGVVPNALRVTRLLGDLTLPANCCQRMMSNVYGDVSTVVSVFRASNEAQINCQRIQSMLLFPAMSQRVKAAFTFIQCGNEMMLSVSTLKRCFPDSERVLLDFKTEVRCLLEQLSMRLMTLSQATFLPTRVSFIPPILLADDQSSTPDSSPQIAHGGLQRTGQPPAIGAMTSETQVETEELHTFEQLQCLLTTVQEELDSMRDNPLGDRAEYIRKLTELERRMQNFHECMASRLAPQAAAAISPDAELASSAVAELLAPYRTEAGVAGRRFSREFMRIDNVQRKMSRSIDVVFHSS